MANAVLGAYQPITYLYFMRSRLVCGWMTCRAYGDTAGRRQWQHRGFVRILAEANRRHDQQQ